MSTTSGAVLGRNPVGVLCGFSFESRSELGERGVKRLEMAANATARLLAQAEGIE